MLIFMISSLECVWYNINNYEQEKEFINFLDLVIRVQCFLQVRFSLLSSDSIFPKIYLAVACKYATFFFLGDTVLRITDTDLTFCSIGVTPRALIILSQRPTNCTVPEAPVPAVIKFYFYLLIFLILGIF